MTKSLLVTSDFPPVQGGISNYLWNLWKGLPKEKIVILAPDVAGAKEFDRTHNLIIYRRKYIQQSGSILRKIRQLFFLTFYTLLFSAKEKFSSIHCGHGISSGISGYLSHILFGIPYYIYLYGGELAKYGMLPILLRRKILKNTEKLISVSKFVSDEYVSRGIKGDFLVITPGVEVEKFEVCSTTPETLKRCKKEGKRIILSVGRLVRMKGHNMLIRALPKVLSRIPEILYVIVGNGPYRTTLERMVDEKGLRNQVLFTGYVDEKELPGYYHSADLFILPSQEVRSEGTFEGFGIVFLEAGACGKPVIGGDTGGVKEAVVDGVTGLLVDPLNPDEISDAIIKLLQNKEYAKKLGEEGRKRVEREFKWEERVETIKKLL